MEIFDEVLHTSITDRSTVVFWLKSGAKISGRVKTIDDVHITIEVTGEMSEFHNYNAIILKADLSAVAWILPKD